MFGTTKGRRSIILQKLKTQSEITVAELHEEFCVSEVTIRKDLNALYARNLLIRTRGGAICCPGGETKDDTPINNKRFFNIREKQAIGRMAASLIEEGNTILLDSGTTTLEIARNLDRFQRLTIITNAINIAVELLKYKRFNVILLGGNLREPSQSTVGPVTESNLKAFFCDKLFLGVDSFNLECGLSTPNIEEANINQLMLTMAGQVVAVFDSSKINKRSFAFIAPVDHLDVVVTDSNMPTNIRTQLNSKNIKVYIAEV
ncbi:MAG: DeoR/GlpR family DNA-binding transcription regulator [Alistipes sp.]